MLGVAGLGVPCIVFEESHDKLRLEVSALWDHLVLTTSAEMGLATKPQGEI